MSQTITNGAGAAATTQHDDLPIDRSILASVVAETMRRVEQRPSPEMLRTFDEITAFADYAKDSDFVPKDYKGKPGNIVLAVMMGKEIGIPPVQSMQCIAVINGRPALWGPTIKGICISKGVLGPDDVQEVYEGEEGTDEFTAICRVRRKGSTTWVEGKFSQRDAKVAGLYGKNVHATYPRRMAMWRARGYAYVDCFPDVLRGLPVAEVAQEDYIEPLAWELPEPQRGWFAANTVTGIYARGARDRLQEEQSAWKWLGVLDTVLRAAPTLEDVEEIIGLASVQSVRDGAPVEAQARVDATFADARARFAGEQQQASAATTAATDEKPPRKPRQPKAAEAAAPTAAATQATDQKPPSEAVEEQLTKAPAADVVVVHYYLADENGDMVEGETGHTTNPAQFADWLVGRAQVTQNLVALIEHNVDSIDDARKASGEAATILAELDKLRAEEAEALAAAGQQKQPEQIAKAPPPADHVASQGVWFVALPVNEKGVPQLVAYRDACKVSLASVTRPAQMAEWLLANQATYATMPKTTKGAIEGLVNERRAQFGGTADAEVEDRDLKTLQQRKAEIKAIQSLDEMDAYGNGDLIRTVLERFQRDRPELAQELKAAGMARRAELREAAAAARATPSI